jgi:hypothetical protein
MEPALLPPNERARNIAEKYGLTPRKEQFLAETFKQGDELKADVEKLKDQVDTTINDIYHLLPGAVLIPILPFQKAPSIKGWQKIGFSETQTPEYQADLQNHLNTGVLLGSPSGHLCAIDVDSDEALAEFRRLNEDLFRFVTKGSRGAQIWCYMDGDYPTGLKPLKTKDNAPWGEWRANGGQSVVRGLHPNKIPYQFLSKMQPARIRFEEIKWPDKLVLPWLETKARPEKAVVQAKQTHQSARTHVKSKRATLEDRIPIQLPGKGGLHSDFCRGLGVVLSQHDFYVRGNECVQPSHDRVTGNLSLAALSPHQFITAIEAIVVPFRVDNGHGGPAQVPVSMDAKLAATTLASSDFLEQLNLLTAVNSVRLPILRDDGTVELLAEGYDKLGGVLTTTRGKDWASQDISFVPPEAATYWRGLLSEFCFHKEDTERSISIVLAAALTLFGRHLLPPEVMRPAFLITANSEGAGKSLLAKIMQLPTLGLTGVRTAPATDEEMAKAILAKIIGGGSALFLDNVKGQLSSPSLEALITSPNFEGRILGRSKEISLPHSLTCFITGNGLEISPDLRRRCLHIDLFLSEIRAEDRKIVRNLEDSSLLQERPKMLQALNALVQLWVEKGRPVANILNQTFVPWSSVIGGILESNGFVSPFTANAFGASGDLDTRDIETLIGLMIVGHPYRFAELIDICQEHGLFSGVIPDEGVLDPGGRSQMGKLFRKFVGRLFGNKQLMETGLTKDTKKFYVQHNQTTSTTK